MVAFAEQYVLDSSDRNEGENLTMGSFDMFCKQNWLQQQLHDDLMFLRVVLSDWQKLSGKRSDIEQKL
eukprot:7391340-Ditylum_brightwellii.AAC.1